MRKPRETSEAEAERILMAILFAIVALLFTGCAVSKTTIRVDEISELGQPMTTELRTLAAKTAGVTVGEDEQGSAFTVDAVGAFNMRTGSSSKDFDGATAVAQWIDILGTHAAELAPFFIQYLQADAAMKAAESVIQKRIAERAAPAVNASAIPPMPESPPGTELPINPLVMTPPL